jgi:hypothetical protein
MGIYNTLVRSTWLADLFSKVTSQGDVKIQAATHLTADLFCNSLHVYSGHTLYTDCWRIICLTQLLNYGTIRCDADNGHAGTAGAGGAYGENAYGGTLGAGGYGGEGGYDGADGVAPELLSRMWGQYGGSGGDAGGFSGGYARIGTPLASIPDFYQDYNCFTSIDDIVKATTIELQPGVGGGGGASVVGAGGGGGGGAGGNNILLTAFTFKNYGTIIATGGAGGNGYDDGSHATGGGGGGAGGNIIIFSNNPTTGTVNVSGGYGGIGKRGGHNGLNGDHGYLLTYPMP